MIESHVITNHKLSVKILHSDKPDDDVHWPYDHVPRVGEKFRFGSGRTHIVRDVCYQPVETGGYTAVVTVDLA